jgi:dTDP-glucose 4,6-dehydratase
MRVFVTGGAGFIGSHFARSVITDEYPYLAGAEVTVFDKLTYAGNLANLAPVADSPRYRFVQGDICSALDLENALAGHDLVVHFAAESHVDRSVGGSASEFVTSNVVGTQRVLAAAIRHGVRTVVHVSTDEVYGSIESGSWKEDHILEPNSPYAASKAGADLVARSYHVTHGLDVRITRCSNNYGPYHFPEKVIPLFLTNLLDGLPVPLYGVGANIRDWLFVGDHCRGLALVLEKGAPGAIYTLGGGGELSNRSLTVLLVAATGRDWSVVDEIVDPRGAAHDMRYSVDYGKIAALGYRPQMSFEDGIALTVRWFRDNRAWWEPLRARAAL